MDIDTCVEEEEKQPAKISFHEAQIRLHLMTLDEIRWRSEECGFTVPANFTKEEAVVFVMDCFKSGPDAEWFEQDAKEEESDEEDDTDDLLFLCVECGGEFQAKEMDEESNKCHSCYNSCDIDMSCMTLSAN